MPRPLEDVPADSWARIDGVVFDIDDTVTRDGRLELEAFDAMHRLARAGVRLVAATGRALGWADVSAHLWPVDFAVGENGAGWAWRSGSALAHGYFQDAQQRAVGRKVLDAVRTSVFREMPNARVAGDQYLRRCDLAYDIGETESMTDDDIDRLVGIIEGTGARSTVSSVHAHAVPGEWDKASGVVRAARLVLDQDLDQSRDRWLFIGDSGNDAPAFAHFPLSIGVRNVERHLARMDHAPEYITTASHGGGFKEMADAVLGHRPSTAP